jgi:hypothetical protein
MTTTITLSDESIDKISSAISSKITDAVMDKLILAAAISGLIVGLASLGTITISRHRTFIRYDDYDTIHK